MWCPHPQRLTISAPVNQHKRHLFFSFYYNPKHTKHFMRLVSQTAELVALKFLRPLSSPMPPLLILMNAVSISAQLPLAGCQPTLHSLFSSSRFSGSHNSKQFICPKFFKPMCHPPTMAVSTQRFPDTMHVLNSKTFLKVFTLEDFQL